MSEIDKSAFCAVFDRAYRHQILDLPRSEPARYIETGEIRKPGIPHIKVCGIHNVTDLISVVNGGADIVGLQFFESDQRAYFGSLSTEPSHVITEAYRTRLESVSGIPAAWSEIRAMRGMLEEIGARNIPVTPVIMTDRHNPEELLDLIKTVLPSGYDLDFMIQPDHPYDPEKISLVRRLFKENGLHNFKYIQSVPAYENDDVMMADLSSNRDVDYLAFDSSRGKGIPLDIDSFLRTVASCGKEFFVSGGLSAGNVGVLIEQLNKNKIKPYAFDFQTASRLPVDQQVWGLDRTDVVYKNRIDQDQVFAFYKAVESSYSPPESMPNALLT